MKDAARASLHVLEPSNPVGLVARENTETSMSVGLVMYDLFSTIGGEGNREEVAWVEGEGEVEDDGMRPCAGEVVREFGGVNTWDGRVMQMGKGGIRGRV